MITVTFFLISNPATFTFPVEVKIADTADTALCSTPRELGFLPVEVNASDTRNKSDKSALKGVAGKLSNSIRELATNTAIGVGVDGKPKRVRTMMCLMLRSRTVCRRVKGVGPTIWAPVSNVMDVDTSHYKTTNSCRCYRVVGERLSSEYYTCNSCVNVAGNLMV